MKHNCLKCKYLYKPESMYDYYKKTFTLPEHPCDWGKDYKQQFFFLCSSPNIAETDHTNESVIMTPCRNKNFNGECHYYREENAEDILPSAIEIKSEIQAEDIEDSEEPVIHVDDIVKLSVEITPYTEPEETEERQKLDIDGEPMTDEDGNPVMETVVIKPEFINEQDIEYFYQWYKNGRKLWKETKPEMFADTSEPGTNDYFCEVIQKLKDNGDGGDKTFSSRTVILTILVEPKEEPEIPEDEPEEETD